VFVEEHPWD
jgi:hypothetical protein